MSACPGAEFHVSIRKILVSCHGWLPSRANRGISDAATGPIEDSHARIISVDSLGAGDTDAPLRVSLDPLGAGAIQLGGATRSAAAPGEYGYTLASSPLNMDGLGGSTARAVPIEG